MTRDSSPLLPRALRCVCSLVSRRSRQPSLNLRLVRVEQRADVPEGETLLVQLASTRGDVDVGRRAHAYAADVLEPGAR